MGLPRSVVVAAGSVVVLTATLMFHPRAMAETLPNEGDCRKVENPSEAVKGWCVAITRRKGNCLACHTMVVNPWPEGLPPGGNIAPPLVAMKQRYPERDKLRQQIANPHASNPDSVMPPFGRHKLLSDQEIDQVVEFLLGI